jgi:hypothetical protein
MLVVTVATLIHRFAYTKTSYNDVCCSCWSMSTVLGHLGGEAIEAAGGIVALETRREEALAVVGGRVDIGVVGGRLREAHGDQGDLVGQWRLEN